MKPRWPIPLAAAGLLIGGSFRMTAEGVPNGGILLALGSVVLGWWMHHSHNGKDEERKEDEHE